MKLSELFLCLCVVCMSSASIASSNTSEVQEKTDFLTYDVSETEPQPHRIQTAIDNAKPNDIVKIPAGDYEENLVIEKSISIVGDGNVFVDGMNHGSVILIAHGTNVNLTNLCLFNGSAEEGGGIYNEGRLNMVHCVVQNCNATKRGGLICNKGKIDMRDMILMNGRSGNGGGVYNEGTFIFVDTLLKSNKAVYGGGFYNKGTATMDGRSQISCNCAVKLNRSKSLKSLYATCAGGGVYNEGKFSMKSGTIRFNTGACLICFRGVGVYNIGTFILDGGDVTRNIIFYGPILYLASSQGGGFYNAGTLVMTGGIIKRNAVDLGGGVCNRGDFYFEGGKIIGNRASDGGGVYNKLMGWVFLCGGEITSNEAIYFGGGICNKNCGNSIQGNKSIVHDNIREDFS